MNEPAPDPTTVADPVEGAASLAPLPSATVGGARRLPIAICVVAGAASLALARSYRRPSPPVEPPAPGMTVGSDRVTLTDAAPAWRMLKLAAPSPAAPRWSDAIPARVAFDEARTSRLGAPLAGRVTAVAVERGQHVKAGAALFVVASPSLAELHAERAKAAGQRATARTSLDRVQALVDAGSLPAKELVTAKQEASEAELAVRLAEQKLAALRVAGGSDASFTVTAPRDGVVVEKAVSVGQLVEPSSGALLAIADLSQVWVVADLFETDAGAVAPGTRAKVSVGGAERDATVDQVSAIVDPERHTVPVRLRLANADGALRPNAYATLRWLDAAPAGLVLPVEAVLTDGAHSYVYRKDPSGALARQDVKVGVPSGGNLPVLEGVAATDQIVVAGAILLDNQIELDH